MDIHFQRLRFDDSILLVILVSKSSGCSAQGVSSYKQLRCLAFFDKEISARSIVIDMAVVYVFR